MLPENHVSIIEFRIATEDGQSSSQCYAVLEKCFANKPITFDALLCTADEMAVAAIVTLRNR
jgi:DNA-binding LacI/PurR family transcriptional regulator